MSAKINVFIVKDDEWFVAKCIENNVVSQGKTIDEAIKNLKEAISLYYEDNEIDIPFNAETLLMSTEVSV